jgi:hypothetical protein
LRPDCRRCQAVSLENPARTASLLKISSRLFAPLNLRQNAALDAYAARERAMLIEDIKKNEPTVVLVDNFSDHWSSWLQDNPDVAGVLRDYRLIATFNDIEIRAKAH